MIYCECCSEAAATVQVILTVQFEGAERYRTRTQRVWVCEACAEGAYGVDLRAYVRESGHGDAVGEGRKF